MAWEQNLILFLCKICSGCGSNHHYLKNLIKDEWMKNSYIVIDPKTIYLYKRVLNLIGKDTKFPN